MTPRRALSAALVLTALALPPFSAGGQEGDAPAYVGSQKCAECHQDRARQWRRSHHALAWTLPDSETVLGDFEGATFEYKGTTTRFSREGDDYFVTTADADGRNRRFPVAGVAGIAPLQQYLLATEGGRLQAFDVAWDVEKREWYPLYPDLDPSDRGLHWSGPYRNWNGRCAECHATDYAKNYDQKTRSYRSTQAEIGVGCEACHGPGEAHLAWAAAPESWEAPWPGLSERGLTVDLAASAEAEVEQCAGCHSRREPFDDRSPLPGTRFHDAYRLALLREGLYEVDGTMRDEVYVYGSFLQAKMHARGVRCSDCHDPHAAGEAKPDPVTTCTACHSPAGNPRFPSLRAKAYDTPAHHFHPPDSKGAQCVACHMVERVYMGVDPRRDHSFRIPRPDLSTVTGAPNACNDCHTDRDSAWAAAEIARRFPASKWRGPHFSEAFAAARRDPAAAAGDLLEIAERGDFPGIVRATALDMLRGVADPALASRAAPLVGDPDPLVRAAATGVLRALDPVERVPRLAPALDDPLRAVRIAAAREFLTVPPAILPPRLAARVRRAMDEWRATLVAKADFPETQMALGGVALAIGNYQAAGQAFREAATLDPQLANAWAMLVRIRAATGDLEGARAALAEGLAANPESTLLLALADELAAMQDGASPP